MRMLALWLCLASPKLIMDITSSNQQNDSLRSKQDRTTSDPLHFSRKANLIAFLPPAGSMLYLHMALQYGSEFIPKS
jgi:hypothetical protein